MFLQHKLLDATKPVSFIPRKGWIREDLWIKTFTKDMLVKVASSKASQLRDLHANMDRQIARTDQLRLVNCCYDPLVLTNLCAMQWCTQHPSSPGGLACQGLGPT
jgi:hypothetical protein